eukprot:10216-Heterococcus_DN1.PRE.3
MKWLMACTAVRCIMLHCVYIVKADCESDASWCHTVWHRSCYAITMNCILAYSHHLSVLEHAPSCKDIPLLKRLLGCSWLDMTDLKIRNAILSDMALVLQWNANEGWSPGAMSS